MIPALVMWNLIISGTLFYVLQRQSHDLDNEQSRIMLFFLHNGYRKEHFYWEFFILGRKTALTIISILVTDLHPLYKMVTNLFVVFSSLLITSRKMLFSDDGAQRLELWSHWMCIIFSMLTYTYETELKEGDILRAGFLGLLLSLVFFAISC
eukprot:TRINITY_DN3814_c0_g3_i2.p2 TRINITY_DN3814_c0_g3~~TRINITY_DN3814_c0_g3_i2.p2  ORF type:complete len:152 (+),score=12.65 TRINITY_DN3814_c0_g3_i2:354-809(+)